MNQFELFCIMYFALSYVWENSHNEKYENLIFFLGDVNPFIWKDIGSADPAIFIEFCKMVPQKEISLEESYKVASEYINALPYYYADDVREAFKEIDPEKWLKAAKEYLSQPHKK